MAIQFHPRPGAVLMCDFSKGFKEPEMTKMRPVIVLSPVGKRMGKLCTIVALSTVEPAPIENWHYMLPKASMPDTPNFQRSDTWVKGDMIYTVSFDRLDRIKIGREQGSGKRLYFTNILGRTQMKDIYGCLLESLNLGHIKKHL